MRSSRSVSTSHHAAIGGVVASETVKANRRRPRELLRRDSPQAALLENRGSKKEEMVGSSRSAIFLAVLRTLTIREGPRSFEHPTQIRRRRFRAPLRRTTRRDVGEAFPRPLGLLEGLYAARPRCRCSIRRRRSSGRTHAPEVSRRFVLPRAAFGSRIAGALRLGGSSHGSLHGNFFSSLTWRERSSRRRRLPAPACLATISRGSSISDAPRIYRRRGFRTRGRDAMTPDASMSTFRSARRAARIATSPRRRPRPPSAAVT